MTAGSVEPLRKLFEIWGDAIQFVDVLIRQAHPGPRVPAYRSLKQKMHEAERFGTEDNTSFPVLFDDLQGMVHQSYGGLADPTYLIDSDGRVAFYSLWTHAPTLHRAIKELMALGGRGVVNGGIDRTPHIAATITDGWRFLRRGLPQSFVDMELATPGSATLLWLAHQFRPLLAPITLRAEPLPREAKIGLASAGIIAASLVGRATATRFLNGRTKSYTGKTTVKQEGTKRNMQLRNISEQVMVITGATSGIGLTTARMAAEKGAQLMLVARNEEALRQLTEEINNNGGFAAYHATDVAEEGGLREAARKAVSEFGRIDTWVNNAGGSLYGRLLDVSIDDLRRVFETNVWGVVYGSRIAAEYLREQGGAIINVGSEVSDAPVPLQGIYSASKHAVKGFTDALRIELEADGLPISVTLIKPTAIHTPFTENAKNYLPYEPQLPSPLYAPELVAEAILHCAGNPTRDFFVGEMAKLHSSMALNMPRLYDKFNESNIDSMQNSGEPARINRPDGLHETNSRLQERGSDDRFVLEESLYQRAKIHPLLTAGILAGSGLAIAALMRSRSARSERRQWETDDGVRLQRNTPLRTIGTNMGSATAGSIETSSVDIAEHMEVIGSDGGHVGTVDKVEGDQIKLTRDDSPDGRHHRISMNDVHAVNQNRVMLTQTANEAKANWRSA